MQIPYEIQKIIDSAVNSENDQVFAIYTDYKIYYNKDEITDKLKTEE